MADLDTVMEDISAEKDDFKPRTTLSRNSILSSSGGVIFGNHFGSRSRHQSSSRHSSFRSGYDHRLIRYENTYRMEPHAEEKLDLVRIRRVATTVIETAVLGYKYNPNYARQFSMSLAERVRSQMKTLPYPRYKIVTQACIGQKKEQDLRIASRCLWDLRWDRHVTITKETSGAYVTVTIFFVYTE